MATFATDKHEIVWLSSNLFERLQDQDSFNNKWLGVLDEPGMDDVLQFVYSPAEWFAVPNQVQVQVDRWRSKLPCEPRG
jgi:hypothetical protein